MRRPLSERAIRGDGVRFLATVRPRIAGDVVTVRSAMLTIRDLDGNVVSQVPAVATDPAHVHAPWLVPMDLSDGWYRATVTVIDDRGAAATASAMFLVVFS